MMIRCRLSCVKCSTPDSLLFGNAVQLYYLLQRYSLATSEKGKRDIRPALCVNDSRPNSALTHELSRDPHEKRRELPTADDVSLPPHARAILTFRRATQNVREDLVKVREVRKRPACYHR